MRKKPYPITELTGGLSTEKDPLFLVDRASPNLKNIRFDKGLVKKDLSFVALGAGEKLTGTPMHIATFNLYDGGSKLIIATVDWIYNYKTDGSFEIKNTSTQLTGDEDNQFSSVGTLSSTGVDTFVITNGVDAILHWHGDGAEFTALGGLTLIKARRVATFASRLLLGYTTETGVICPKRVRWSVAGNPETWTGTGSGFLDLVDTDDSFVAFAPLGSRMFIIKERSIWELLYVGGTTVFTVTPVVIGLGSVSPNASVSIKSLFALFGDDSIYLTDGLSNPTPIDKQVRSLLFQPDTRIFTAGKANRVPGVFIKELNQYWFCIPAGGSIPNKLFKYYLDEKVWTLKDKSITAFGFFKVSTGTPWSEAVGTWTGYVGVWKSRPIASDTPTLLITTPDGYVYEDDRLTKSSETMIFETKDWMFAHAERWMEFRVQARYGPFQFSYSIDQGVTWSVAKTCIYSSELKEYIIPLNLTSQKLRAKITSTASDCDVAWVEPWYLPRVRSKNPILV